MQHLGLRQGSSEEVFQNTGQDLWSPAYPWCNKRLVSGRNPSTLCLRVFTYAPPTTRSARWSEDTYAWLLITTTITDVILRDTHYFHGHNIIFSPFRGLIQKIRPSRIRVVFHPYLYSGFIVMFRKSVEYFRIQTVHHPDFVISVGVELYRWVDSVLELTRIIPLIYISIP